MPPKKTARKPTKKAAKKAAGKRAVPKKAARKSAKKAAKRSAKRVAPKKAAKKAARKSTKSTKKAAAKRPAKKSAKKAARQVKPRVPSGERIVIEDIERPGHAETVDADKYQAMRDALLRALPASEPGMTHAQMVAAVKPAVPEDLFPDPAAVDSWTTLVCRDLEAKHAIRREWQARPLRWWRAR